MDKQTVTNVTNKLSWHPFWSAGFLFTIGAMGNDFLVLLVKQNWFENVLTIAGVWALWPLLLGALVAT